MTRAALALDRRSLLFAGAAIFAAGGAVALKPTEHLAASRIPIDLERQIPQRFGAWTTLAGRGIVLPNPELQASLDALYSQVLARSYGLPDGSEVMLSIAYGKDQGSEVTAVHRPEFCYAAQGFRIRDSRQQRVDLQAKTLEVQTLVTSLDRRVEPVMYWITLDQTATLPGLGRKLEQISLGLRGYIPDGMLVRVSSISRSGRTEGDFALQTAFVRDLFAALQPDIRARYFGT
jgi:EpsI family protein